MLESAVILPTDDGLRHQLALGLRQDLAQETYGEITESFAPFRRRATCGPAGRLMPRRLKR
jgi:hypothetical protein